jgi:AcrR family transcriptional regulator
MDTENKESLQARKSRKTRAAVLEGAVMCFVELGYSKTTTSTIVKKAGVSRGAMAHHFSSLADVVHSCVIYIKDKRVEQFNEIVSRMRSQKVHVDRTGALQAYWSWLQTDYAQAYYELLNVSRTQADLREIFVPINHELEETTRELFVSYFPELKNKTEILKVSQDIIQYVFDGIVVDSQIEHDQERFSNLLVFLNRWLDRLWEDQV